MKKLMNMTKTSKKLGFGFLFVLVVLIPVLISPKNGDLHYKVKVYSENGGWGYDILSKNKTFIHQPFMPSVEGNAAFKTRKLAKKAGTLVVTKLEQGKSPSVSRSELIELLSEY